MNRKLLLQMLPPEKASRETVETIRADRLESKTYSWNYGCYYGYAYGNIYKKETRFGYGVQAVIEAETCDHILRLSIYSRYAIHRGDMQPEVVVYIDRQESRWLNYYPETGKWTRAMIDHVKDVKLDSKTNNNYQWASEEQIVSIGAKKAADYFGACVEASDSIHDMVYAWQRKIREDLNDKERTRKLRKWEQAMELVPPLPEDFQEWSLQEGMRAHNYLLRQVIPNYDLRRTWIGKYRYTCTYCGEMWESNDPGKHNEEYECPFCDTKIKLKYWGRQKGLEDEEYTGIIQRYGEGYIFRKFHLRAVWKQSQDYIPRKYIKEACRVITDAEFNPMACYEEDDNRRVGRCWNPKTTNYMWQPPTVKEYGSAVMYTRNIKEVMCGADKWLAKLGEPGSLFLPGEGEPVVPTVTLRAMKQYAFLEYVERAGMTRLAWDIFHGYKADELNTKAGKLKDLLMLSGDSVARAKRLDIGWYGYKALRYAEEHGEKISDDTLQYVDRRKIIVTNHCLSMERTGLTLQQTVLYITKMAKRLNRNFEQTRNRYKDYLDLAEERGMDLHDDIVRRSTKMDELHDRWSDEKQARNDAKRGIAVDRKFKTIARDCVANQAHFGYKAAGLCIIVPKKASDLITEGRTLHHCVGASESYMSKMNSHKTFILFLRRVGEENSPYYTLEVKWDGQILQAYSEFDRKPDYDNKIGPWLQRFQKAIQKRIAKENTQQIMQEAI